MQQCQVCTSLWKWGGVEAGPGQCGSFQKPPEGGEQHFPVLQGAIDVAGIRCGGKSHLRGRYAQRSLRDGPPQGSARESAIARRSWLAWSGRLVCWGNAKRWFGHGGQRDELQLAPEGTWDAGFCGGAALRKLEPWGWQAVVFQLSRFATSALTGGVRGADTAPTPEQ